MSDTPDQKAITVYMPARLYERTKKKAKDNHRSVSAQIVFSLLAGAK